MLKCRAVEYNSFYDALQCCADVNDSAKMHKKEYFQKIYILLNRPIIRMHCFIVNKVGYYCCVCP